jgi:hypothetical protein
MGDLTWFKHPEMGLQYIYIANIILDIPSLWDPNMFRSSDPNNSTSGGIVRIWRNHWVVRTFSRQIHPTFFLGDIYIYNYIFGIAKSNLFHWMGLRENLQETIDFPIKYGAFPIHWLLNLKMAILQGAAPSPFTSSLQWLGDLFQVKGTFVLQPDGTLSWKEWRWAGRSDVFCYRLPKGRLVAIYRSLAVMLRKYGVKALYSIIMCIYIY